MHRLRLIPMLLLLLGTDVAANNLQISNISLTGQNTASDYTMVEFDMSWDNSWRDNINWDAAWIFIKWSTDNGLTWQHAKLNPTAGNHTAPSGSTITPSTDSTGVFLYRSANGSGAAAWTNVQLRWEYGVSGIADDASILVKVFGIEMVYVKQGSFWLGDSSMYSLAGHFASAPGYQAPFRITSEDSLILGGTTAGNLVSRFHSAQANVYDDDFDSTTTKVLPAAYPKGYNAFYCMKYEVTQEQYKDFLNTLTRAQQDTNTSVLAPLTGTSIINRYVQTNTSTLSSRNGIRCDSLLPSIAIPITFYCDLDGDGIGNSTLR